MRYFTKTEIFLWCGSVLLILTTFYIFDRVNYLSLTASLIGVTSLILGAKGNPLAQVLMIVFSLLYSWISYGFRYYGEMITYCGMTLPMAVLSLISWVRNPCEDNPAEVKIRKLQKKDLGIIFLLTVLVTAVFYMILRYFHTVNLIWSTISVTTSFLAVCLTYLRSPWFAAAYACNDFVLILLWLNASLKDRSYSSVLVCFFVFFINDVYGFLNWKRMEQRQSFSQKSA